MQNLLRTVAFASVLTSGSVNAMTFGSLPINDDDNSRMIISMTGKIETGDYAKLINVFKSLPEDIVVVGFLLNSPGGNIGEAVKITEAIKGQHIGTMVAPDSQCASACFLIFAAGEPKVASTRSFIGVHSLTTINVGEDDSAKSSTVDVARYCSTELKIPSDIIGKMVSTPASSIYQLSIADLTEMGVDVSDDGPSPPSPRDLIGRHTAGLPATPPTMSPTPVPTASVTSPMFQKGLADHTAWQKWVDSFSGEFRAGIEWWASQRSMPNPGSCAGPPGFVAGCNQAKARLASYDLQRKAQPEYKLGWNAYTDAPSYFVQVASRQIYSDAEAVKQSVASLGAVQIVPVTVSGVQWYRVEIGPFVSADEAAAIRARVIPLYDDAFIAAR
jgi:ATP-dependent protease ClpP protease subunit